jgi:cyclophilin family peptidyl-prolyl cis-trans isomerase
VAKTDSQRSSRTRRDREAERLRAAQAARAEARRRAQRRQRLLGVGVVAGISLAVFGVVKAATGESERKASSTSTTAGSTTSSVADAVQLPAAPTGSAIAGSPPCPPATGAARVTRFDQAPPDCLAPGVDYEADIRTSKGVLTVDLHEDTARKAVNTFVFLARYRYYDGLPVSSVRRGAYAEVDDPVHADGAAGPGFRHPVEARKPGDILTALLVGLLPTGGTTGGGLLIGMPGEQYLTIPQETATIGMIRDARVDRSPGAPDDQRTVQQLINDAATPSGAPSQVITIEGVDIREIPRP